MTNTTRVFQDMLNEYLPNSLLREELIQRDYVIRSMQKDPSWKGGNIPVPFKAAGASSIKFGGLTSADDVASSSYIRGNIAAYREMWGTLIFNQADLMQHDGKIPDSTFLSILPDELEDFMDYVKEVTSVQLGSGPHFATATSSGTAGGVLGVDQIARFQIGQKLVLDDDNSAAATYYVIAVDINTEEVTLSATRGGAAADIQAYTTGQNAKCYQDGVFDAGGNHDTFISMRSVFLSAANGGTTNVHGKAKTSAPILQATNISGAAITPVNILDKLFDAFTECRRRGKGLATEYLMSLVNMGSCMKQLELQKGSYKVVSAPKSSLYGWMEVTIMNVTGQVIKLVGIQEMDDDIIPLVDWRNITFRSNGYFRKRKSPEGKEYFEVRAATGYQYLVDVCLFGEAEYRKPGHSAIIHSSP